VHLPALTRRVATVATAASLALPALVGSSATTVATEAAGIHASLVTVTTTSLLSTKVATVAPVPHRLTVYKAPNGAFMRYLSNRTPLGSLRTVLVTASRSDGWLQVLLPVRPNGTRGWIRKSAVITTTNPMRIVVSRKYRVLKLYRNGVFVMKFPVAVGKPSTPSPAGLFYVTDHIATGQPGGAYGPYALGLSGFSNVLFSFAGSDGVVGIHGTNETSSVGHAVTHGCIRLFNRDITKLYSKVWIGTPVVVK
jgi:lipoprotein-anchoring transpeptidase ErfK/SrfK